MSEPMEALFAELFEAASESRRLGEQIASTVGQTQARWQTMWTVGDAPRTVPQVARRLGVSRQSVQRLVNELEAEGQVALVDNPDHRTSPLVALTPAGRDALSRMNRAADLSHAKLLEQLPLDEVEQLRSLLRALTAVLQGLDAPTSTARRTRARGSSATRNRP